MNRFHLCTIAATLAASTLAIAEVGGLTDQPKSPAADLQQIGKTPADETSARQVRTMLANAVNDGLSENKFDSLITCVSKADRERIGSFQNRKIADLNTVIAQFRVDFKAKYNQDFDMRPELFRDVVVYAGKDKNSATVLLPDLVFSNLPPSKAAIKPIRPLTDVVTGLTLNLINEGPIVAAWKINIPDEITGEQLKGNLIKHIQMLDDQKATWPADALGCLTGGVLACNVADVSACGLGELCGAAFDRLLLGPYRQGGHPSALQSQHAPVADHLPRYGERFVRCQLAGGLLQHDRA